jgi:hypothetical protein
MGGHPYFYIVPYEAPETALQKLRIREFKAGRYNPAIMFPRLPVTVSSPAPGPKHRTIDEALGASGADGTRSILDIDRISDDHEFGCASPLSQDILRNIYGTTKPTKAAVEANMDFLDDVERGFAVYFLIYDSDLPTGNYVCGLFLRLSKNV